MRFKALRIRNNGAVTAAIEDIGLDELPVGDVLLRAHYSSVNYKDALAATGKGKILKNFPMIGGIDVAGVVQESADDRFKCGDEVLVTGYGLGQDQDGGFSQYVRVPGDWIVPLQGVSLFDAMAIGTAGFTAALAIQRMLDNGQTPELGPILVTGATGGVGSIAIDCLSGLGFEVAALTGKAAATGYLQGLGATSILNRHNLDMGERPLEKSVWGGAIDTLGGKVLSWLTRSTVPHGNIASCGLAGGIEINTTAMPFILRGINLLGINSATCDMRYRRKIWQRLAGDMQPRHLRRIVTATVGLYELHTVFERMLAGETRGRYVVRLWDEDR